MKKITIAILLLAMALSMTACAGGRTPPATEVVPGETTVLEYYPVTVVDQAGREVVIPEKPERIVSGYYISTSLLIALGQEEKIVGLEAKADKRAIYGLSAPELQALPSVGTAKEFDLEGCAALNPDLVILPMKLKDAANTLTELGIPVILVNPENQELLDEARELVARSLNCWEASSILYEFTQHTAAELQSAVAGTEAPVVYLAGNSSFLSTAGGNMYQSSLMELAGGKNAAEAIADSYWAEVGYEQVLAWNPDFIILAADAAYTPEDVQKDENLAGITAIEEGRVYQMPKKAEAWDSPVPGGILGAVWMASILHPDRVSEESCHETIETFYETFYGFSYENS